jgi:hypothetical protein
MIGESFTSSLRAPTIPTFVRAEFEAVVVVGREESPTGRPRGYGFEIWPANGSTPVQGRIRPRSLPTQPRHLRSGSVLGTHPTAACLEKSRRTTLENAVARGFHYTLLAGEVCRPEVHHPIPRNVTHAAQRGTPVLFERITDVDPAHQTAEYAIVAERASCESESIPPPVNRAPQ